jgi:hypothetical protein
LGARKTINAPPAAKKIPVAPCRSVPAKKTAATAASNRTTCTTADRRGGELLGWNGRALVIRNRIRGGPRTIPPTTNALKPENL